MTPTEAGVAKDNVTSHRERSERGRQESVRAELCGAQALVRLGEPPGGGELNQCEDAR